MVPVSVLFFWSSQQVCTEYTKSKFYGSWVSVVAKKEVKTDTISRYIQACPTPPTFIMEKRLPVNACLDLLKNQTRVCPARGQPPTLLPRSNLGIPEVTSSEPFLAN